MTSLDEERQLAELMAEVVGQTRKRLEQAKRMVDRTKRMLDSDIRAASRHGVGVVRLAQASGYSASRVRQILKEG